MAETEQLPPSPASSPPDEFSFEPSFVPRQEKSQNTHDESFTVDLSPADDIFFHGHLLPLRLLSHLQSSVPPRESSTGSTLHSADDDLVFKNHGVQVPGPMKSAASSQSGIREDADNKPGAPRKNKSTKSFSLFGLQRRKAAEGDEEAEHEKQSKRKIRFDVRKVRQAFKTMAKSFLLFRSRTEDDILYASGGRRKSNDYRHSWGNFIAKENWRQEMARRGRYASAPVSTRASPTNSGILVGDIPSPKSATNDSTIEELQAAIQAAILHCKNSIAKEEMKLTT